MVTAAPNAPERPRHPSEREILESAAAQARTNLSDFVRRRAVDAAEIQLLAHPQVTIPAADWEKFEAWANTPAKPVPALLELAAIKARMAELTPPRPLTVTDDREKFRLRPRID